MNGSDDLQLNGVVNDSGEIDAGAIVRDGGTLTLGGCSVCAVQVKSGRILDANV